MIEQRIISMPPLSIHPFFTPTQIWLPTFHQHLTNATNYNGM